MAVGRGGEDVGADRSAKLMDGVQEPLSCRWLPRPHRVSERVRGGVGVQDEVGEDRELLRLEVDTVNRDGSEDPQPHRGRPGVADVTWLNAWVGPGEQRWWRAGRRGRRRGVGGVEQLPQRFDVGFGEKLRDTREAERGN